MRSGAVLIGLSIGLVPVYAVASLGTVEWSRMYEQWSPEVRTVYTYQSDPPIPRVIYDSFLCSSFDALVTAANTIYTKDLSESPRMTGVRTREQFDGCHLIDEDVPVDGALWIGSIAIFTANGTTVEGSVYKGLLRLFDGNVDVYILIPPQEPYQKKVPDSSQPASGEEGR